jgi:hypothetical protein
MATGWHKALVAIALVALVLGSRGAIARGSGWRHRTTGWVASRYLRPRRNGGRADERKYVQAI